MSSLRSGLTVLSWSSGELLISPSSVRLTPAALFHYRYEQTTIGANGLPTYELTVTGLAVLDQDGLVLADLPGDWEGVAAFAQEGGVPVHAALDAPAARVRAVLAARAPGWRRIVGVPPAPLAPWRKPVAIGLGVVALGVMIYLTSTGFWYVWRGFSTIGRLLIDVAEIKWLIFLFSPLLLFLAPVRERLTRRSVHKGLIVGSTGGLHLKLTSGTLYINRGPQTLAALPTTPHHPLPTPITPTPSSPTPPTPAPSTPAPLTPSPPAPPTPAPSTPAPSTPAPSTPAPSTPAPSTPAPSTPAPLDPSTPTCPTPAEPLLSPVAESPPSSVAELPPSPAAEARNAQLPEALPPSTPASASPADPAPIPDAQAPSNPVDRPEPEGRAEGLAARLFLYRYRDLAGLVVLDADGHPVHHLPGPWSPEHVNRFAARHNLPLEIRTLTHDEYLALTTQSTDATT